VGSYWKPVAIGSAILGGIGLLVLAGRKSTKPSPPKRVALIGDSYAVGLGPELAKIFPDFKFEGHVGTTSSQWANHAAACGTCGDWLTAYKPDVVLVSLGVNDGHLSPAPPVPGVPTHPYTGSYQRIVQALQSIGARVVWIEPPAAVKTDSRSAIESLGVPVVPATQTPLSADGLHPTGAGYRTWAKEIAAEVDRVY
jgi:lysophospholipase L1-like esterase